MKGKWALVDQDLNLKSGLYYLVGSFTTFLQWYGSDCI